jgi:hypothetical protein
MRRLVLSLLVALGLSGSVSADGAGIEATISGQIEAFRADDFDRAFTYASPGIQGLFGTSQNFGLMVRQGYPMVWRPAEVEYLELREIAGNLWQKVRITDAAGTLHILDYQMIETESGWKINAVQVLEAVGLSA